ncbi:MAG: FAD-dependent oxidoreductase [Gammaproteobacteria bacterium]|nr:FAD-dependent oxidoreductase [Gammaproteobacteria bacterium]
MKKIFTPIQIGPMTLKNRIVAAPSVTYNASPTGEVTDRQIEMYRDRAMGGFGLIQVEAATIRDDGKAFPCFLAADHPKYLPGLSKLVEVCHLYGAKVGLQLIHTGRNAQKEFIDTDPVAPSDKLIWRDKPRVLTTAECEELIALYANAGRLAASIGFDAVCFHGSLGHLPAQFLSPLTNDRTDKYGERTRFVVEMIQATRAAVGSGVALIYRGAVDEGEPGGLTIDDWVGIVPVLEDAGIDCIDVYPGMFESSVFATLPLYMPEGHYVPYAERIKAVARVPVMVVGKLMHQPLAETVVEKGQADLVSYTRPMFADPHFPKKMMDGRYEDIRMCICCDHCVGDGFQGRMAECSINASFQREKEFRISRPAPVLKKVLVAGGGVGGMEAARVAAERGHKVILYEKTHKLGGLLLAAASMPHLYMRELRYISKWQATQLEKLGVEIRLGQAVTADIVAQEEPDAIFVAIGAVEPRPCVPGVDREAGPNVLTLIDDYLLQDARTKGKVVGARVVVVGSHHGVELAVSLAHGKEVIVLEEAPRIGFAPYISLTVTRMLALSERFTELKNLELRSGVKLDAIVDGGVQITNEKGATEIVAADTVIFAQERVASRSLSRSIRERFSTNENMQGSGEWGHYVGLHLRVNDKVCELYELGDCVQPKTCKEAIHGGANFARLI